MGGGGGGGWGGGTRKKKTKKKSSENDQLTAQVVNLGTTTKLCSHNFVPKPHLGPIVVSFRPKIG